MNFTFKLWPSLVAILVDPRILGQGSTGCFSLYGFCSKTPGYESISR